MNERGGYVKLYRKAKHSSLWKNWQLWRLFEWCLMEAAYKPVTVYVGCKAVDLQRGQLIFGRRMAHDETGLSEQTVRTCLHALTSGIDPALTIKSTKTYSIVTIVKWDEYQNEEDAVNQQPTSAATDSQPTPNQEPTKRYDGFHSETSVLPPTRAPAGASEGEEVQEIQEAVCAEHVAQPPALPASSRAKLPKPVIAWDGRNFSIPNDFYASWGKAYPAVDIDGEVAKAAAWLIANPKKAKKDYGRFLNNWLNNAKPAPHDPGDNYSLDPALVAWAEDMIAKGVI